MQDNNIEGLGSVSDDVSGNKKLHSKMSEPTSTFQYWQLPVLVLPEKEWKVNDHPQKLYLPFYNLQASLRTFLCKNKIFLLIFYFFISNAISVPQMQLQVIPSQIAKSCCGK